MPGLERLDFVYLPSRDVAADVERYASGFGAEVVFAVERFGTRVAMLQVAEGPALLLAGHLEGDRPVLVHRVADLERAIEDLAARGVAIASRFEIPPGEAAELELPGPQRLAIYELSRPGRLESIRGRRDFLKPLFTSLKRA